MPTWFNKANLYTFGWCLYWLQGSLYSVGSLLSQFLVFSLLFISLYYCFIANTRYKLPVFFTGLNMLMALFSLYGVFLILGSDNIGIPKYDYLKGIWISLLPIYAFYVFFKEKQINESTIYVWICAFTLIAIAGYYYSERVLLLKALLNHSDKVEFTNNAGYAFLSLIPAYVLLYKKPLIQYVALGLSIVYMLMSMKRGAIIIGVMCLLWFMWNSLKNITVKKKMFLMMLMALLCFGSYWFVQNKMSESMYFQQRIEETLDGNSSGRDDLYGNMGSYYWNGTEPIQFLFGSGAFSTLRIFGIAAHNDWLEIAINQGLMGIMFFLMFLLLFAKNVMSKSYEGHVRLVFQLSFMIFFMKSLFSMSYSDMNLSMTFVLGYCSAQEKKNEQIIYSH